MKAPRPAARRRATTIRVRLGFALSLALVPVLVLSAIQSVLSFRHEANEQRAELLAAADRSASGARARIAASEILLDTLTPGSIGLQCAQRLAEVQERVPGYANLIRFDAAGRLQCSAAGAPADPNRSREPWFLALAGGKALVVTSNSGASYAGEPALLAGVPALDAQRHFDGALVAIITLASLRPELTDSALPPASEVALTDASGRYLSTTRQSAFPDGLGDRLAGPASGGSSLWFGNDRVGALRVFSAAPLVGRDVFVVLSAPSKRLVAWAWLNSVPVLLLPLLGFSLALAAVLFVAERGVIRWITYLQRIAAIYARGRFSVHPVQAEMAPPEIRDLAQTLDGMAQTISARDAALMESLGEKDALMREIHHRVKNNLQVISSLINLQQRSLHDPGAKAAMSDTRQRIGALALVYRALYQGPDLKRVDLSEFLDELIAQLILAEPAQCGPVETELAIDPLIIDPDRLAPLALFAVEAITNAKKHGLTAGGVLGVTFTVRGPEAELAISDTGTPGRTPVIGDGVGRTLMTAFARQLRGEAMFHANRAGGLTAKLLFPTPDADEAA